MLQRANAWWGGGCCNRWAEVLEPSGEVLQRHGGDATTNRRRCWDRPGAALHPSSAKASSVADVSCIHGWQSCIHCWRKLHLSPAGLRRQAKGVGTGSRRSCCQRCGKRIDLSWNLLRLISPCIFCWNLFRFLLELFFNFAAIQEDGGAVAARIFPTFKFCWNLFSFLLQPAINFDTMGTWSQHRRAFLLEPAQLFPTTGGHFCCHPQTRKTILFSQARRRGGATGDRCYGHPTAAAIASEGAATAGGRRRRRGWRPTARAVAMANHRRCRLWQTCGDPRATRAVADGGTG